MVDYFLSDVCDPTISFETQHALVVPTLYSAVGTNAQKIKEHINPHKLYEKKLVDEGIVTEAKVTHQLPNSRSNPVETIDRKHH
jgi:hypothetical protein